ncbi:SLBB domain-containing protein, partial [Erythrobacter sp.]|uniref:SLBB domain-containing protein n=1 Tax=Erythrobacter sp. TaxID=1042 RepID=UPI00311E4CE7
MVHNSFSIKWLTLMAVAALYTHAGQAWAQSSSEDKERAESQSQSREQRTSQDESDDSSESASIVLEPTRIGDVSSARPIDADQASRARTSLFDFSNRQAEPNAFEVYVERMIGKRLKRFGSDLLLPGSRDFALRADATIPPDYRVNVGDTISISLTGSAEGSVERTVDGDGNIFLPSVGTIHLAGVRQGDLKDFLSRAIGTQYRNFRVGVRTTELRGLRVFVTGYAQNPGAFSVNSLSTAFNAILQAGGPTSGGSFRVIKLVRDGQEYAEIDLYRVLMDGDRSQDAVLENEDVILVPPALAQVAIIGSVNNEAIYEILGGETIKDVLALAGGVDGLGERDRVVVYSADKDIAPGPKVVSLADFATAVVRPGDIVQVLPSGSLIKPIARQSVVVRIEGEVESPGNYYVAPGTPLSDVVGRAGGLTDRAYPFGTEFVRQSIIEQQRRNFAEALDQFELTLATAPLRTDSSTPAARQQQQLDAARSTLEELRTKEPDGRLVLDVQPTAAFLPSNLLLENGDRIIIPPRPTSVGVYGAVYRPASFHLGERGPLRIKDYVELAGGAVRAADKSEIFVIRANG